jgi:hypothetical protein
VEVRWMGEGRTSEGGVGVTGVGVRGTCEG